MSYWKNEDKIDVKQTQVSVASVNGLSYSGGQRVDIEVPPTIKFFDGKNSYLNFDVKITPPAGSHTRLQLDPHIGGSSLIKNIRIYAGSRNVLLEEVVDYNVKVAMEYSYNQDDSLRNLRALKEGCLSHSLLTKGSRGTTESVLTDIQTNPYYKRATTAAVGDDFDASKYLTCKCSIPLHTGIFAGSKKIFPALLTDGLYIEVDLESPENVIKQLDSVNRHRRTKLNPFVFGSDGTGATFPLSDATNYTEIFLEVDNGVSSVENCPFVVGERINFCEAGQPSSTSFLTDTTGAVFANHLLPKIKSITMDGGYVKLTTDGFKNPTTISKIIDGSFVVYSAEIDQKVVTADGTGTAPAITAFRPTYTMSNVELVVAQVELDSQYEKGMMSKMREGGAIELDYVSCTNHKFNLLKTNRNASVNIDMNASRAKSCIIVPVDDEVYNSATLVGGLGSTYEEETTSADVVLHSNRSGMVGVIDFATQYQFVIDGKQEPSRPVSVSKINKGVSISASALTETEKGLNQAGIPVRSFVDYNRNFVIAKCYGLNDGVRDLRGVSQQLQILYNESLASGVDQPPVKNKMLMCFLYHIRRLVIKGDSVNVVI